MMAWWRNHYECDVCDEPWDNEWSCCCNDKCPSCNHEIEPSDSDDLTVTIEKLDGGRYVVIVSPETAEDSADYETVTVLNTLGEAESYASNLREERGMPDSDASSDEGEEK